jgi:hypothetical protein
MMVAVTRLSAAFSQTPRQIRTKRGARPSPSTSAQLPGFGILTSSDLANHSAWGTRKRRKSYLARGTLGIGSLKSGDQWVAVPPTMYQVTNRAQITAPGT